MVETDLVNGGGDQSKTCYMASTISCADITDVHQLTFYILMSHTFNLTTD